MLISIIKDFLYDLKQAYRYFKLRRKGYINSHEETTIFMYLKIYLDELYPVLVEVIDLDGTGKMYEVENLDSEIKNLKRDLDRYYDLFIVKQIQWGYPDITKDEKVWNIKRKLEKRILDRVAKYYMFLSY